MKNFTLSGVVENTYEQGFTIACSTGNHQSWPYVAMRADRHNFKKGDLVLVEGQARTAKHKDGFKIFLNAENALRLTSAIDSINQVQMTGTLKQKCWFNEKGNMARLSLSFFAGKDKDGKTVYNSLNVTTFETLAIERLKKAVPGQQIFIQGCIRTQKKDPQGSENVVIANSIVLADRILPGFDRFASGAEEAKTKKPTPADLVKQNTPEPSAQENEVIFIDDMDLPF